MSEPPRPSDVVTAFERGELILPALDHQGHVYLAWCYLHTLPLLVAVAWLPRAIRRFASDRGASDKYNATLTLGYLLLIHERIQAEPDLDWEQFQRTNADLFSWPDGPLNELYTPEALHGPEAKRELVPPDRFSRRGGGLPPPGEGGR